MPKAPKPQKERPYECQLCHALLAEDELAYVCEHVARGEWQTLAGDKPTRDVPTPDLPCTACALAFGQGKKKAEQIANIHLVCRPCYKTVRARNIDGITDEDRARGYVLVRRVHWERAMKQEIIPDIPPIEAGQTLRLGFSPIPSTWPVTIEPMWVRVTEPPKRGVAQGKLAAHPELFKRKVLKAHDAVAFKASQVLEAQAPRGRKKKKS
ncbi:MAG: hypothetical protein JWP97_226 [Labilithrix sp.]|nr:hypothetical protein [Labilithrix sp.]